MYACIMCPCERFSSSLLRMINATFNWGGEDLQVQAEYLKQLQEITEKAK